MSGLSENKNERESNNKTALDITNKLNSPSLSRKEVNGLYSQLAKQYDTQFYTKGTYHGPFYLAKHVEELGTTKDARISDIGAGTGLLGVELQKLGFTNVDAVDPNEEMLKEAQRHNVYKNTICDYVGKNKLTVDNDTYDVVIGCGVFTPGHITEESFDELCRITKPDGLVVISSNEMHAWEASGFYLVKLKDAINQYEKDGKWTIANHTYVPHLANFRASVTTVRISTN